MNTDQITTPTTSPDSYGREIPLRWWGLRGVIGRPDLSPSGNLVLRAGQENEPGQGWSESCHVVLTPEEGRRLIGTLVGLLGLGEVTNHGTENGPAVCLRSDGSVVTFGAVELRTGADADGYVAEELYDAEAEEAPSAEPDAEPAVSGSIDLDALAGPGGYARFLGSQHRA